MGEKHARTALFKKLVLEERSVNLNQGITKLVVPGYFIEGALDHFKRGTLEGRRHLLPRLIKGVSFEFLRGIGADIVLHTPQKCRPTRRSRSRPLRSCCSV